MKKFLGFIFVAVFAASCIGGGDDEILYRSTVTFKRIDADRFYFEDCDSVALVPYDIPVGFLKGVDEQRVMILFHTDKVPFTTPMYGSKVTYGIDLVSADTISTKQPVVSMGTPALDSATFGYDPVAIFADEYFAFPSTTLEDGYLTIHFVFNYSPFFDTPHEFNLITGSDPSDPYLVRFSHNAHQDVIQYDEAQGAIAFPLKSLPDTKQDTVALKLVWDNPEYMVQDTLTFKYCSRTDW